MTRLLLSLCLLMGLAASGCMAWQQPEKAAGPLLPPATASDESVTLEVFFARFPLGDADLSDSLWEHVDEQELPRPVRRELATHGIRAGVVGGTVPPALSRLLKLTDERADPEAPQAVNLEQEPTVRRRLVQLRLGRRGELVASDVIDRLPMLLQDGGEVHGRTFEEAQGVFAVQPGFGGRRHVQLAVVPEIHYGEPRQQFEGRDGIFRLEMARPRHVFDRMAIDCRLTPGQMLVVGCMPNRLGSLGHHFLTDKQAGRVDQKLLVIRLARMPRQDLFEPIETDP